MWDHRPTNSQSHDNKNTTKAKQPHTFFELVFVNFCQLLPGFKEPPLFAKYYLMKILIEKELADSPRN